MKIHPVPVEPIEPIGARTAPALVNRGGGRGGWEEVTTKIYPKPPHDLQAARLAGPHTLGSLGRALGIKVEVVSGLEWGRYALTEEEWRHVLATAKGETT